MDSYYSVRQDGAKTVVEFRTESLMNPLDLERLNTSLMNLVDGEQRHQLILDFSPVKYLSSQAIGVVLALNKKVGQHEGGKLVLCGVGPQLMQLLKITRLNLVLKVTPTQKEALALK
jgi:anti-sigma B factor antagonist